MQQSANDSSQCVVEKVQEAPQTHVGRPVHLQLPSFLYIATTALAELTNKAHCCAMCM